MDIVNKIDKYISEESESTKNCLKTLKANISFYEKMEDKDEKAKEVLDTMKGILSHYEKEGSFSPEQAKAVFNTSEGIKKMTS
jgi:transcriptional regulator